MNNFLKRTLSGTVFVILLVGLILWNQYSFGIVFAIITALTIFEFHKLTNHKGQIEVCCSFSIISSILLFICSYLYASAIFPNLKIYLIYILSVVCVLIAELYRKKEQPVNNWAYFLLGQVFVALPFSGLNFILFFPSYRPLILLAVFVIIWINDTGAYITGVSIGKHRLFERISPKKSWEGFIGGAVFALGAAYVFSLIIPDISLINWFIFAEIIVIAGTFGDLIESLLKRSVGVKDSGNFIPGHGGLLDRFDSILLAAPMIFIYLQLIGI